MHRHKTVRASSGKLQGKCYKADLRSAKGRHSSIWLDETNSHVFKHSEYSSVSSRVL